MKTEQEPTFNNHVYHPTRKDGFDRNLRKLNFLDFLHGVRCICDKCCEKFESSRKYKKQIDK